MLENGEILLQPGLPAVEHILELGAARGQGFGIGVAQAVLEVAAQLFGVRLERADDILVLHRYIGKLGVARLGGLQGVHKVGGLDRHGVRNAEGDLLLVIRAGLHQLAVKARFARGILLGGSADRGGQFLYLLLGLPEIPGVLGQQVLEARALGVPVAAFGL